MAGASTKDTRWYPNSNIISLCGAAAIATTIVIRK